MIKIKNHFFPLEIENLAKKIADKDGELFLVGGSLRDLLLERKPLEYDFEIHANLERKLYFKKKARREKEEASKSFINEIGQVLQELGPLQEVGKSFGIIKVKGKPYDFSFPRREKKTGQKRQDYLIEVDPFLDLKSAQRRRDFTINSLAYSFNDERIYDNFSGLSDLDQKKIRITDPLTFPEDPLRVYRLAQFISRLDFRPDQETLEICQKMDLDSLSLERIEAEIGKLFTGNRINQAFVFLQESKVLKKRHLALEEVFIKKPEKLASLNELVPYLKDSLNFHQAFLFFSMHFIDEDKEFPDLNELAEILASFSRNLWANRQCLEQLKDLIHIRDYIRASITREQLIYFLAGKKTKAYLDYYALWDSPSQELEFLLREAEEFLPLISGKDLIEEGFQPSENFKRKLEKAKGLQLAGKDKKEILEILRKDE